MVWFTLSQLQANNTGIGCYQDSLSLPDDLFLQAMIAGNGNYTVNFYLYSTDGTTQYEDATAYFEYYFAVIPNTTQQFMNARLQSFSAAMCERRCYVFRVVITQQSGAVTVFDKYTNPIYSDSCCDVARGITFSQAGYATVGETSPFEVPPSETPLTGQCGQPLIRLISTFDCQDEFTGEYYGIPSNVLSGEASFAYVKVNTFQGRIVPRPTEITREISYNCVLQRTESAEQYYIESLETFPGWKMVDIQGQFRANHIYVDNFYTYKEYQFTGGAVLVKPDGARDCDEVFKLQATLNDCIIRQTFSCGVSCSQVDNYFLVPNGYNGGGFYNENGALVATVIDGYEESPYEPGLLEWLRAQDGVTDVELIITSPDECTYAYLIKVVGTGNMPTSLYYDRPIARNRAFAIPLEDLEEICGYTGSGSFCAPAVIGFIAVVNVTCSAAEIGDITVIDVTPTDLFIDYYGAWQAVSPPELSATLLYNEVTFSITTINNTTIFGSMGEEISLYAETIAVIQAAGRPQQDVILTSTNSAVPDDITVVILTTGAIQITGTFVLSDDNELTIELSNISYTI